MPKSHKNDTVEISVHFCMSRKLITFRIVFCLDKNKFDLLCVPFYFALFYTAVFCKGTFRLIEFHPR